MASGFSDYLNEDDKSDSAKHESMEDVPFLKYANGQTRWNQASKVPAFTKIMAIMNIFLGIILAITIGLVAHSTAQTCPQYVDNLPDPYSPALEAVVAVVKKFKPELIFQSETSPLVEEAWNRSLGGIVALGLEESAKLAKISHESVVSVWEPEKQMYGISMYHQMHCLNTIRRSFYRETFFPNKTDEEFNFHKNHCFDFLRQVILCHGDLSMTYWWNKNYTSSHDSNKIHSEYYGNLTTKERAKNSFVFWDIEHKCRMLEPIENWILNHPPYPKDVNPWADVN